MTDHDLKGEEAPQTGYVAYVEESQTQTEPETEANSTGYVLTDEVAMLDDSTGYVEEYLTAPEEKEEFSVGDRIVELFSGIKGVVVGFRDD